MQTAELQPESNGYFSGVVAHAGVGTLYKVKLDSGSFPDPASRRQPSGPHGPSEVVDPNGFAWTDDQWQGVRRDGQVIYELHIGTFTREGTWRSAAAQLDELSKLGVTIVEVMPAAEFPGRFGWGYDGVNLFAPTRLYGEPDDFRAFVNRAHEVGLGVILDVVYNHLGPDGNYLAQFAPSYFSSKHQCEWGEAINFDGDQSGPVREFFISNARYWIDEFHLDGLRLDATQAIFDDGPRHVVAEITANARAAAGRREILIVAENEEQRTELIRPEDQNGFGLDAAWNDDYHHAALVAATGRSDAYYTDYKGMAQELLSAIKWGYLYQGQWYKWQKKPRGNAGLDLEPTSFVTFIENHDQVANSIRGERLHQLTSPALFRALTTLLLLGPNTPMLFQGQEFGCTAPFLYFADHHPELARLVAKGRKEFLTQFQTIAAPECEGILDRPDAEETYRRCILDLSEREKHRPTYELHRELLRIRREDPVISAAKKGTFDGAVLGERALAVRFFGHDGDRLLLVNLGRDISLCPIPEPLLAPRSGTRWQTVVSSESARFGGGGTADMQFDANWMLAGHSAVLLASAPNAPSKV